MESFCHTEFRQDRSENVNYNFSGFPLYIRSGRISLYPNYSFISHWHDDLEFIVVQSGHMLYNINGTVIRLEEGHGLFVNSQQFHYGFSDDFTECTFLCVLLHPMLLCTTELLEQRFVTPVISETDFPFCVLTPDIAWQHQICVHLLEMARSLDSEVNLLQLQSLCFQIWTELYPHVPVSSKGSSQKDPQLTALKDMICFIQERYDDKITLQDIAAAGRVCKSTCCMIFQKYIRQSPNAYLIEYRLKKSIDLINQSGQSITQIGMAVGFTSPSYYAETFRKHYGCTPGEYRKAHAKHIQDKVS